MSDKIDYEITDFHTLNLQQPTRLAAFVIVILLLTITFAVKAGASSAALLSAEAEASDLVCPTDIISYWKLDEGNATTFADSVGPNDATCAGAACPADFPAGIDGSALDFDGIDDTLTVADDNTLDWNNGDSFSIELWFKTSQSCSAQNKVFAGKYSGTGNWWVGCSRLDPPDDNTNVATFYLRDSDAIDYTTVGATSIVDDQWHHLVAIRNATDPTDVRHLIYLDGVLETDVTPDVPHTGNFSNNLPLEIGSHTNNYYFDGVIDEVALYDRVLTPAEIVEHYNGGAGQPYCIETVAPQIDAIPDQTVTVDQPFVYNVSASGSPAPTFSLPQKPTGMNINANTGHITWTPTMTGDFDVIVRAENLGGQHEVQFTIKVRDFLFLPIVIRN